MIQLTDKKDCCGCTACFAVCPENCITMREDNEGFLYPAVDVALCTACGLCDQVCPVLHPYQTQITEPTSFACINKDENIRSESSSGGLFTVLAEHVMNSRGVVFGAKFNERWEVVHAWTDTVEGLKDFRGSKYAQSQIGNCYHEVKNFLSEGRQVLFSGTPCQVAGLNHFLKKKYENLLTVDFVCHSIPSPKVFQMYVRGIAVDKKSTLLQRISSPSKREFGFNTIRGISFRDKSFGWKKYALAIHMSGQLLESNLNQLLLCDPHDENIFMKGFLGGLFVRPSCHFCPARNYSSGSDIMIADCWGIAKYHPEMDDDKGTSLALLITDKGRELFEAIKGKMKYMGITYNEVEPSGLHSPIMHSSVPSIYRKLFFKLSKRVSVPFLMKLFTKLPSGKKLILAPKMLLRRIIGGKLYTRVKNRVR